MKFFNIGRIRQSLGQLRCLFGPRAAILLYHRVTESETDPYILRVTPQHFEEHLQVIRDVGYPMRLADMARCVRSGSIPKRAVCVTFDDGYQDNLYTAKPLLERYDVPATAFITTGTIGRGREFWWDELGRIFLQPGRLPDHLQLDLDGKLFDWNLGDSSAYSEDDSHRDKDWTLLDSSDPKPRHVALRSIHESFLAMGAEEQLQVLDRLLRWAGIAPTVRTNHRVLGPDEVAELERDGTVEVGVHTVNHLDLSIQPAEVQQKEIRESKAMLEEWLGHAVRSFAYPYGFYSEESVAIVRKSGFDYACACMSRAVRRDSDLFLLPRVDVFNWGGDQFAQHLRKQLGG